LIEQREWQLATPFVFCRSFRVSIPEGNLLFAFALQAAYSTLGKVMPPEYDFWVYILARRSRNLYIGFTTDLRGRMAQHNEARPGTYTARYNIHRLVYYEHFKYVINAISRETELKHWTRTQKIALIESVNPTLEDLSLRFGQPIPAPQI
jgi:putative endonuclease